MEKCAFCQKSNGSLQLCTCDKVWYCSDSHRIQHYPQHGADCFPAFVHSEEDCGRYWVASRNISKGELIFSEKALAIGPSPDCPSASPLYPTCLGCCRTTNTSYNCSKCRWPMCSKKCETIPQHAHYECKIFRKNKINSSTRPEYYLYIQYLRGLLLSTVSPTEFCKMMELEAHREQRKANKEESLVTQGFVKFVTQDCALKYDFETIDKVVGVNRINSYSADVLSSKSSKRSCTALFWKLSFLNHDCLPNTRTVIYENPDYSLNLGIYASTDIRNGECITQQYFPIVKSTMVRRKALKEWFFDCDCRRCRDSSEFGTFFSCLKCASCSGFITPLDPLNETSLWECGHCKLTMPVTEIIALEKDLEENVKKNENCTESLEQLLQDSICNKMIHLQHHIAINVQYEIVRKVVKALNNEKEESLLRRCVQYCKNILKVVDKICPGFSYYRGVILYFLGNCWYALYDMGKIKDSTVIEKEIIQGIWEGIQILQVEPEGTIYREMAEELQGYLRSLKEHRGL